MSHAHVMGGKVKDFFYGIRCTGKKHDVNNYI